MFSKADSTRHPGYRYITDIHWRKSHGTFHSELPLTDTFGEKIEAVCIRFAGDCPVSSTFIPKLYYSSSRPWMGQIRPAALFVKSLKRTDLN